MKKKIGILFFGCFLFSLMGGGPFLRAETPSLYQDKEYGFEIAVPEEWTEIPSPRRGDKSVTFAKYNVKYPQKKYPFINITIGPVPPTAPKTPVAFGAFLIHSWKRQEPSLKIIEGPKEVVLNQLQGVKIVSESELKGRRGGTLILTTHSYYFLSGDKMIEIKAFDDKTDFNFHLDMIERSIQSFRLIPVEKKAE